MAQALRYSPDIEQAKPDEEAAIAGIIEAMRHQSEIVADREGHAVRASHAKSTGLAVGRLEVLPDLPPQLAQGLFSTPRSFDVAVRLAQGPGELLPDKVSTHRGLAIKVFGVEGERLVAHRDTTQDFVLASGPTFPSGTAQQFLKDEKQLESATPRSADFKSAVSSVARNTNRVLRAVGTESAKADFFGHPFSHPLSEPYFSQAPIRYGDFVAKLAAFPAAPAMLALADVKIDASADPDAFRTAVVDFFQIHDVVFDLRVQFWTDAEKQPIEDASIEWSEEESPFVTVARLSLPRQDVYGVDRQRYFDEVLSFRPAHALEAHRPLGSVMRARLKVYEALSRFRQERNGVAPEEPTDASRIP